ncbi:MAG TPA: matrixin family metalloprotease [Tepidiformaceae bacterium]|nr:matrixin family metalloprotease [Tepidiformaceae bacterium]
MTRCLLFASALILVLFAGFSAEKGRAEASARDVRFVAVRDDGARVGLQFIIHATSERAAVETALAAAQELVPGATILTDQDDAVSAQFGAWWWQWDGAELPVTVSYNAAGAAAGFGEADIEEDLKVWSSVPGSAFRFAYGGPTDSGASVQDGTNDGKNVIAWRHLDCQAGCVLGVTTKTEMHEADIVLNSNPQAKLGNGSAGTTEARSVLLHELGHMAGLDHSCALFACTDAEQDAVMYFQYRGPKHTLAADDVAGLTALYPVGAAPQGGQPRTLELSLQPGWLLTVLPPGPIEAAMDGLACADAVYSFDGTAWHSWLRGAPAPIQDLTTVAPGAAYWVHASAACSHLFALEPR